MIAVTVDKGIATPAGSRPQKMEQEWKSCKR
jgi:hypothetical protein